MNWPHVRQTQRPRDEGTEVRHSLDACASSPLPHGHRSLCTPHRHHPVLELAAQPASPYVLKLSRNRYNRQSQLCSNPHQLAIALDLVIQLRSYVIFECPTCTSTLDRESNSRTRSSSAHSFVWANEVTSREAGSGGANSNSDCDTVCFVCMLRVAVGGLREVVWRGVM